MIFIHFCNLQINEFNYRKLNFTFIFATLNLIYVISNKKNIVFILDFFYNWL
jgi:hypothetical protein